MGVWMWSRKGPSVGEQFDGGGCVCCGGVAPVVVGISGGENGEWANVVTEAFGDSDRGWRTRKRLQGSGGGGCTDEVEFSGWGFEGEVSGTLLVTI
nr:hypothetical protein [Tanacetum cinerariifolium]